MGRGNDSPTISSSQKTKKKQKKTLKTEPKRTKTTRTNLGNARGVSRREAQQCVTAEPTFGPPESRAQERRLPGAPRRLRRSHTCARRAPDADPRRPVPLVCARQKCRSSKNGEQNMANLRLNFSTAKAFFTVITVFSVILFRRGIEPNLKFHKNWSDEFCTAIVSSQKTTNVSTFLGIFPRIAFLKSIIDRFPSTPAAVH